MKAQEQIEKLRTLQESFDNLVNTYDKLATTSAIGIEAELQQGKEEIVSAIEYKGGTSSADKSLQRIAEDIKEIPNFDQYLRLAGVLAGNSYSKDSLQGHNENIAAGSVEDLEDTLGVFTRINAYAFQFWDLIRDFNLHYVVEVKNAAFNGSSIRNFTSSSLSVIGAMVFASCNNLQNIIAPNVYSLSQQCIWNDSVVNVVVGTLTYMDTRPIRSETLRNLTIGQGTNINLALSDWKASNVIAEGQSAIDELNENLYNNLLTKLYDHSTDGETRTLRLGWLAKVTQENIDYANSKGWTLTT